MRGTKGKRIFVMTRKESDFGEDWPDINVRYKGNLDKLHPDTSEIRVAYQCLGYRHEMVSMTTTSDALLGLMVQVAEQPEQPDE